MYMIFSMWTSLWNISWYVGLNIVCGVCDSLTRTYYVSFGEITRCSAWKKIRSRSHVDFDDTLIVTDDLDFDEIGIKFKIFKKCWNF